MDARPDIDLLDERNPFEIDGQAAHLFKHGGLGIEEVYEVWRSDPILYPAKPPADWVMIAEVAGKILAAPIAPPNTGNPSWCRPIGCYEAPSWLASRYREDR
jgi:hypothetical protein